MGFDTIIVARGGGSIEDLWCFNDEALARRIAAMEIPVISAVGHETDFTVCDFVSDLRAPTPSAAAELAVPDISELSDRIALAKAVIEGSAQKGITQRQNALDSVMSSPVFSRPEDTLLTKPTLMLGAMTSSLDKGMSQMLHRTEKQFFTTAAGLEALSPIKTMLRGFAVPQKEGSTVHSISEISEGDNLTLRLADGSARCTVNTIVKE